MQAQLELRRSPSVAFVLVIAILAALFLSAALGYSLKTASIAPARTQIVVVHDGPAYGPQSDLTRAMPVAQPEADTSCAFASHGLVC
jgi:FlaG/FlaF family flagellin (archaellin)